MPLSNRAAERRSADAAVLREVLIAAAVPRPAAELEAVLRRAGAGRPAGRATLAWLLKYDLVRVSMPAARESH